MTRIHTGQPKKRFWLFVQLRRLIISRVWHLHAPVVLMIKGTPTECLQTLAKASKPRTQQLHLRNLFINGRRYFVQPNREGFRLTTTRSVAWQYRRRTAAVAVLRGTFSPFGEAATRVQLRTRINIGYLLSAFLVPLGMTSILIYVPWSPVVIGLCLVIVYGLSWVGHRTNAVLEAAEMVWFVQKALDDLGAAEVGSLGPPTPETIGFQEEWQKFYEQHKGG